MIPQARRSNVSAGAVIENRIKAYLNDGMCLAFAAIPIYPYAGPVQNQLDLHKIPFCIANVVISYKVDPRTFLPEDFKTQILAFNVNVNQNGGPVKLIWDGNVERQTYV